MMMTGLSLLLLGGVGFAAFMDVYSILMRWYREVSVYD